MANNPYTLSPTAAAVYSHWLKKGRSERPRTYLGASILGHECEMYLWLYFRGIVRENFDGRMYRLFDRGKREEEVFTNDLRSIGIEVKDLDENGNQFAVSALGGHFGGHLDGVGRGFAEAPKRWHVVEYKTHSDASFRKLCKEGVRKAKPMHYAQMTVYMGHTGLKDAFYFAVNKDNDELYTERLEFSQPDFEDLMAKAKRIIDGTDAQRCAGRPDDFRCKSCPCHHMCWDTENIVHPETPLNCRTCCHATADTEHEGAQWTCRLGHSCSTEREACGDYLILPSLVRAEIVDGSPERINYRTEDIPTNRTVKFAVFRGPDSAKEMMKLTAGTVAGAEMLKEEFPGASVTASNDLAVKYSSRSEYEEYYRGNIEGMKRFMKDRSGWCDWSKPVRTDRDGDEDLYEYRELGGNDTMLVRVNKSTDTGVVIGVIVPF